MAKKLPFPLEFYDHPAVKRLKPLQAGLFRILIEEFWKTGYPIPDNDYAIEKLSNSDRGAWLRSKSAVMAAIDVLMPMIESQYLKSMDKLNKKRLVAENARRAIGAKKNRLSKLAVSNLYDAVTTHVEITPVNSPGILQNTGQFDPIARKKAMQSTKGKKQTLTDE